MINNPPFLFFFLQIMSKRPHLSTLKKEVRLNHTIVTPQQIGIAWREAGLHRLRLMFADPDFMALPMGVWKDFVEWSKLDQTKYQVSRFDCENFALSFSSQAARRLNCNGAGIVFDISGRHAYTALLVKEQEPNAKLAVAIFEPQTDRLVSIGESMSKSEAYKAQEGFTWFL